MRRACAHADAQRVSSTSGSSGGSGGNIPAAQSAPPTTAQPAAGGGAPSGPDGWCAIAWDADVLPAGGQRLRSASCRALGSGREFHERADTPRVQAGAAGWGDAAPRRPTEEEFACALMAWVAEESRGRPVLLLSGAPAHHLRRLAALGAPAARPTVPLLRLGSLAELWVRSFGSQIPGGSTITELDTLLNGNGPPPPQQQRPSQPQQVQQRTEGSTADPSLQRARALSRIFESRSIRPFLSSLVAASAGALTTPAAKEQSDAVGRQSESWLLGGAAAGGLPPVAPPQAGI